ncbi:MAG: hypothetical protein ACKO4T_06230 [Planctomycetaceae bacterium]
MFRSHRAVLLALMLGWAVARGQSAPYNPYADGHDSLPPVAADGTIHWGTFYKSATLQRSYERLWNLGACRGTNKAITVPVAENKLVIDLLPEKEFSGIVRGVSGEAAGGLIAFDDAGQGGSSPFVARFHPAGVTRFQVVGRASADVLAPGMVVRLQAEVDARGHVGEPVAAVEVVSPPAGFVADPVRAGRPETIVGTVVSMRNALVTLRVDAGKLRRITFRITADAVVALDAARFDLVGPGDTIEVKGRLWSGEGAMGGGTIFVSDVLVSKPTPASSAPGPRTVGVAGTGRVEPVE